MSVDENGSNGFCFINQYRNLATLDLPHNISHYHAADVGQAEVAAVEAVGELFVVEAQEVQDRGMQVGDADFIGKETLDGVYLLLRFNPSSRLFKD